MSLGQRLDEIERQKQCFIDFMDAIDIPIYSMTFNSSILPKISPTSLAKFKTASYISIVWVESQTDHSQLTDLWHVLRNMDFSWFKGLDLSFPSLFGNSHEALGHINLDHLTSFSGTTQLLIIIYSFTPSLRAIELTDIAYSYSSLLSFNVMPQVYSLGLPWDTIDIEDVHKAADIWPSIKELYIPFSSVLEDTANPFPRMYATLSYFTHLELLYITSVASGLTTLNHKMSRYLHETSYPRNSVLRTIRFRDSSVAYWNSLESAWDIDMGFHTLGQCCMNWNAGLPRPKWSSLKRLVGKGQISYWEPFYGI
ncbi:hypothetical protein M422DRAFT_32604 [Sphaerobolus stellatus SS14]|uniref:Uncharacterized protein n=1 Tax=Sphaerobolus stellatus (strain SS14) TaxID=990650 RepID=A0A0C9VDV2_SPHS4|nr:hypothetical protein M422DRAFT_32604 [Sphaerobolus stellatus SS14]